MWHMTGVNPITHDWIGVDIIFGVDVILYINSMKRQLQEFISQFYFRQTWNNKYSLKPESTCIQQSVLISHQGFGIVHMV